MLKRKEVGFTPSYKPRRPLEVSRGIVLLFLGPRHQMGGGCQPHAPAASTPGKDQGPIIKGAGWAPGPVRMGGKSRPHRDSISDRPARSQSLYRLSYPVHGYWKSRGSNEGVSGDGMPAVSQIPSFAVTCCLHLQYIFNSAAASSCDSLVSSYKKTRRHITEVLLLHSVAFPVHWLIAMIYLSRGV